MKNVFIINNTAGGGRQTVELLPEIEAYFAANGGDYAIEFTRGRGDATVIARRYAELGEPVRIYACGGDGTLHEVLGGVVGHDNVEMGAFPCGTGNDYVATFGERERFLSVADQVGGTAVDVDIIKAADQYVLNQCSMGFDAAVANNVTHFKGKKFINGSMAYLLAVAKTLFGKMSNRLQITIDDSETIEGDFMFAISAKGKYHGGGMMSAPTAWPASRNLNFMIVRKVTKPQLLNLLPKYIKGRHLEIKDLVINRFGSKMRVKAEQELPVTLDGEIVFAKEFISELVPSALRFILPGDLAQRFDRNLKVKEVAAAAK